MDKIVTEKDYKYFVEKPDPSFSPARNKAVIEETIKSTEKYFRNIGKVLDDNIMNRIDILGSYGDYKLNRGGSKSFKDYAGKRLHAELIGEKILSKIRALEAANALSGRNDKFIQL